MWREIAGEVNPDAYRIIQLPQYLLGGVADGVFLGLGEIQSPEVILSQVVDQDQNEHHHQTGNEGVGTVFQSTCTHQLTTCGWRPTDWS